MMSGSPTAKSVNSSEAEVRPVLGPTGNKSRSVELQKPVLKSEKGKEVSVGDDNKGSKSLVALQSSPEAASDRVASVRGFTQNGRSVSSIPRCRQQNLSLNASCSSDASTDSSQSRVSASAGRIKRRSSAPGPVLERSVERILRNGRRDGGQRGEVSGGNLVRKRCAWVTSNTDPSYAAFHDEEWGLPIHNDKKLFELFSYSTALAELSWPAILSRRHIFRDVFFDFNPIAVSKLQDKKVSAPGSPATSLLSELNLRSIIENARQICKIMDEYGSFDKYIWSFVSYKPILGNFRYPRQVPSKTSKAEAISKDLVKRGFRGVGPTVVYSFMQAAGITNDHLVNCFRYVDCINAGDLGDHSDEIASQSNPSDDHFDSELGSDIGQLNLSR